MNINAYSSISAISPKKLLEAFKSEYRDIPKETRLLSLNQGYQSLAKFAHLSSLESMLAQDSVLIKVTEFAEALASCGLSHATRSTYASFAELLECDVLCMRITGNLCVAIHDDGYVINTPYLENPSPYSPNVTFYSLSVNSENGAWLDYDEWRGFIRDLRGALDYEGDIEEQIDTIWENISSDYCGELFLNENPDIEELEVSSEGRFRQIVIQHSGHTCVALLYDYFKNMVE